MTNMCLCHDPVPASTQRSRSQGIILVFDVCKLESFRRVEGILEEIERSGEGGVPRLLVGNKIDLMDERQVGSEVANELAIQQGMEFIETSARSGHNVSAVFDTIAKTALDQAMAENQQNVESISIAPQDGGSSAALCSCAFWR